MISCYKLETTDHIPKSSDLTSISHTTFFKNQINF